MLNTSIGSILGVKKGRRRRYQSIEPSCELTTDSIEVITSCVAGPLLQLNNKNDESNDKT